MSFSYIIEGRTSLTNTDFIYQRTIDNKTYTTLQYILKDSSSLVDISLPNSPGITEVSQIFIYTKTALPPDTKNFVYFNYQIGAGPVVNVVLPFYDSLILSFPKGIGSTVSNFKVETKSTIPLTFELKIVTIDASP